MLAQYPVMQYLYTNLEKYNTYLDDMIPNNYKQIAVLKVMYVLDSPLWSGTKLWSGKYLEIDNFIVHRTS
jgi:aminopeptidase C